MGFWNQEFKKKKGKERIDMIDYDSRKVYNKCWCGCVGVVPA